MARGFSGLFTLRARNDQTILSKISRHRQQLARKTSTMTRSHLSYRSPTFIGLKKKRIAHSYLDTASITSARLAKASLPRASNEWEARGTTILITRWPRNVYRLPRTHCHRLPLRVQMFCKINHPRLLSNSFIS